MRGLSLGALLWRCLLLLAVALWVFWALWEDSSSRSSSSRQWRLPEQESAIHQPIQQHEAAASLEAANVPATWEAAADDDLVPHANLTQLQADAPKFPKSGWWVASQAARCLRSAFATPEKPPADMRVYSQWGEDGILEAIFMCIGTTSRTYVEFGTESGKECTTRWLREGHGFTGLLMDGSHENPTINLKKELVTAEGISQMLHKHGVPYPVVDHMTIDIDYNTWHVAAAVLQGGWRPRSLCIEFNRDFLPHQALVVPYQPTTMWKDSLGCYFGASALATVRLTHQYGYRLVAVDQLGVNLFFVHTSALGVLWAPQDLHAGTSTALHPLKQLWPKLHGPCQGRQWMQVLEVQGSHDGSGSEAGLLLGTTFTLYHTEHDNDRVRVFYAGTPPRSLNLTNVMGGGAAVGGSAGAGVLGAGGAEGRLPEQDEGKALADYVHRYRTLPGTSANTRAASTPGAPGAERRQREQERLKRHALHVDDSINEFARYIRSNAGKQFPWRTIDKAERHRAADGTFMTVAAHAAVTAV